jgi:D-serine dehydratase
LQDALGMAAAQGRLLLKADHALPVAGSIKARGGVHEVLEVAERVALEHGLLAHGDYRALAGNPVRAVFGQYQIAVGSTGNLGLSIGIVASALGFRAVVHMSADARQWKKDRLRARGVTVVEHSGDYADAVAAGRVAAARDPTCHFVDDESSRSLFLGYSAAAPALQTQLAALAITVDEMHPLFVYLPCGVGGAPGGVSFGAANCFGANVHCFFAEPVQSPCFLMAMLASPGEPPAVYELGLTNRTAADGLAVPRASALAVEIVRPFLAGVFTVEDAALFRFVHMAAVTEQLRIEPSAAAAFGGPDRVLNSEVGRRYLARHGLERHLHRSTHIIWTTGGLYLPDDEYAAFLERGAQLRGIGGALFSNHDRSPLEQK